jgi:hypothetical protein
MSARRALLALLAACVVMALCLASAELVARAFSVEPFRTDRVAIVVEPGGRLFDTHPRLGYRHHAGRYRVAIGGHAFTVTHGPDTLRITKPEAAPHPRLGLWVFGCSFTHGWSVGDEDTFPWRLQQRFPRLDVVNFGVSGYGTVHSLIQLEEALETRPLPAAIVVAYGSFHDDRNTFARVRRKQIVPWNHLGPLSQPAARLGRGGGLHIDVVPARYRELPGMRRLASLHLLEQAWNQLELRWLRSARVTDALLDRFAEGASGTGARLVLAGIWRDDATAERLEQARARGWLTVDASLDLDDPRNNNLPWDPHPSPRAQRLFAERIADLLVREVLSPALVRPLEDEASPGQPAAPRRR